MHGTRLDDRAQELGLEAGFRLPAARSLQFSSSAGAATLALRSRGRVGRGTEYEVLNTKYQVPGTGSTRAGADASAREY